ncbi:hypothetical protein XELAEV_18016525mg [Xenopus laevis]|uniref:Receptor ligand binding region domain-containing protein n=1 Tax=Xenopus laevis TaxID=8355 RepID=A0A974DMF9_XENLA|nr:hypothetical protein XELAEV_18016525mg [Xenopus laevis]
MKETTLTLIFQISYGATDAIFTDRLRFPYFYRVVPNDGYIYRALIQLLKHFGWTWVEIIIEYNESDYLNRELIDLITSDGMCVEFVHELDWNEWLITASRELKILKSTARVIIISVSIEKLAAAFAFIQGHSKFRRIWILAVTSLDTDILYYDLTEILNGSLTFLVSAGEIDGFRDFYLRANPDQYPEDPYIYEVWEYLFHCITPQSKAKNMSNAPSSKDTLLDACGNESLASVPHIKESDLRVSYSVYKAVYLLAHALHLLLSEKTSHGAPTKKDQLESKLNPWKVEY